jgi:hypothetical protein
MRPYVIYNSSPLLSWLVNTPNAITGKLYTAVFKSCRATNEIVLDWLDAAGQPLHHNRACKLVSVDNPLVLVCYWHWSQCRDNRIWIVL